MWTTCCFPLWVTEQGQTDLRSSSHFYRQSKTHLGHLSLKVTLCLRLCKTFWVPEAPLGREKEGRAGVCYTGATEGKVPSPPSPCPGTATMPGKGQVTIWGGRFKDNQHSWLIINFMAREEGRWSLSTLINACSKSTLPSLPDVCFTKAKSCCCY